MQNPENSTSCYRKESDVSQYVNGKIEIEPNNIINENHNKLAEDIYNEKSEQVQDEKSDSINVSKFSIQNSNNKEEYIFDEIIKKLAYPDGNQNNMEKDKINLKEDYQEKLVHELNVHITDEENSNSNDFLNIDLNKSSEEDSKNNFESEADDNKEKTQLIYLTKTKEEENNQNMLNIEDNYEIIKKSINTECKEADSNQVTITLNLNNIIKAEAVTQTKVLQENICKKETEEGKKIIKLNPPLNQINPKTLNGNSTIFQSIKSNKLERDLLSKIVDDITFKKSILDNNNLIKSIKENENKNITLNLKIELNLNLFNDKEIPNPPHEYKIETYAKEKTGINQTKRETEYYINMPIYNNLNFKDSNQDKRVILNQVCNDFIWEIRENKINDAPRISLKNDPNKNNFFNLEKAHYTFDYLKNPNNKIESQCLLEFLNFIDFNLKNTISQDNDFTKLYSKYEFLSNNLVNNKLFYEILNDKNSNYQKSYQKHVNITEDLNFLNKDLVIDLGLKSENQAIEASELKTEEISLNKFADINLFANKNTYDNFNNPVDYKNSYEINKTKFENENKRKEYDIIHVNNRIKPYNGKYLPNNTKTTINSQDIDIINDLQSIKINSNNNLNLIKNSSLKIFKSSNSLNDNSTINKTINLTTGQTFQLKNEKYFKGHQINSSSNIIDDSNSIDKLLICDENKDFIISNNFTEKISKNENNFPDLTEILKFNILNDNLEQQFFLKQKRLKEEETKNKINDTNNKLLDNNPKNYHLGDKRDKLDDLELFDSIKKKKFLIQKNANQEENLECQNVTNNLNFTDQSNTHFRLNKSNNKELRKFKTDSIHKKIKVNILKYIKDYVVEFVPNKRIPNLSQEIVTNVNISYNKELLEKNIINIYKEDLEKNNIEALEGIIEVMQYRDDFNEVMNMKLKDYIVEKYWKSDFHRNKLKRIYDVEPREYFLNYVNLDRDFINYFLNNRGNKKKGNKLSRNNDNMSYSSQDLQDN